MISKSAELARARAKAKKLLTEARAKANKILADARAKAKEIKAKEARARKAKRAKAKAKAKAERAKAKAKAKNKGKSTKAKKPLAEQTVSRSDVLNAARSINSVGKPVRLASLRTRLGGTRKQQDAILRDLQFEGKIRLYREDNNFAKTTADDAAAWFAGDEPRHILYLVDEPPKPLTPENLNTLAERLYSKAVALGSDETTPITILSLRQAFPRVSKDAFDAALLKLADAKDFILSPRHPVGRDAFQTPSDEGGIERRHQWQRLIYPIREPPE